MKPFLYRIAQHFFNIGGESLSHIAFVFPNRRSGKFFQHYLSQIAARPIFSPRILTINTLMSELAQLQPIDKLDLLFTLYEEYIRLYPTDEPFDRFVFWGEMLAGDFDDVDKYMVDAHKLFTNIKDLKDLDQLYLEPEQIEVIRRFWDTYFTPDTESVKKIEFNRLWNIMYQLYNSLRKRLSAEGTGYEGMIFRHVAEMVRLDQLPPLRTLNATSECNKIVFVGFNALTGAERILLDYYKRNGQGDFYWDYDAPTMSCDKENRAGYFIEQNISQFPSQYDVSETITTAPEMTIIPVASGIGQTKQAGKILKQLLNENIINNENAIRTAIVLPDEELLIPTIYSIPEEIDNINITMGYSLKNSSIASLFDAISNLQRHVRLSNGRALYYHIEVSAILNHRLVKSCIGAKVTDSILNIMNIKNMAYVLADFLREQHSLLNLIFTPITTDDKIQAGNYLIDILDYLLGKTYDESHDIDDAPQVDVNVQALEHEYIYHYKNMVVRLNDVIDSHGSVSMAVSTYFMLLGKLSFSVPFEGEPLSGLQVMGVLETRTLDFDNIIILSMNEGTFPMKKVAGSFIPYNLRRGFNLVTTEHQDSIYAYYFYRMIARAKRVYMLYDSRTEGLRRGEMSRFIYQLQHHYSHILPQYKIKTINAEHTLQSERVLPISIPKTGRVANLLHQYIDNGVNREPSLSASGIKTYLNCPLQFYMQYIEGINTEDEINESVDSSIFGSIYHDVMACIYNDIKQRYGSRNEQGIITGVNVTREHLTAIINNSEGIMQLIEKRFNIIFYHADESASAPRLTGENLIIAHTVQEYIIRTLQYDCDNFTPFIYIASELDIRNQYIQLSNGKRVRFKAYIDRVDFVKNHLRIVDYKTGRDKVEIPNIDELFDSKALYGYGAIFQILLYSKLYQIANPDNHDAIQPLIYKVSDAFSTLVPSIKIGTEQLTEYNIVNDEFENKLNECLEELFDEKIDFEQTQILEHCTYCNFKSICKRS